MEETREIAALFHLIDDPDKEVFTTVSERIVSFGRPIIPNLEHLWEITPDLKVQERIELLIHNLHFKDLKTEIAEWGDQPEHDLLTGSLLVSKYLYPDLALTTVLQEIEKMRRNVWLELNSYLTPLERMKVVSTILHTYFYLKGTDIDYSQPAAFLVDKAVETKKGNSIANGILYSCLCSMLDIPLKVVSVPNQFVLAYFDEEIEEAKGNLIHAIQLYLDPMTGHVFTRADMERYFRRLNVAADASYFIPMTNKRIVKHQLQEMAKCFDDETNKYKQDELAQLAALLLT